MEIVQRGVDAWNRDDFDAWVELYDPGLEWFALLEVFRGHAGARQAWESFKSNVHLTVRFDDIRGREPPRLHVPIIRRSVAGPTHPRVKHTTPS